MGVRCFVCQAVVAWVATPPQTCISNKPSYIRCAHMQLSVTEDPWRLKYMLLGEKNEMHVRLGCFYRSAHICRYSERSYQTLSSKLSNCFPVRTTASHQAPRVSARVFINMHRRISFSRSSCCRRRASDLDFIPPYLAFSSMAS